MHQHTSFWNNIDLQTILPQVPALTQMFNLMNLTINNVAIIVVSEHAPDRNVHIDCINTGVRINLPVLNCEESVTNFYQTESVPEVKFLANKTPYYHVDYAQCKLVDQFSLTSAVALRVDQPHQVVASKHCLPRISCTVQTEQDIEYLLN
jgi:hypothetical protein